MTEVEVGTMSVEEYAIKLVAEGAESTAEDDLNESGDIATADHREATELAILMAREISSNPEAFLAWYRSIHNHHPE